MSTIEKILLFGAAPAVLLLSLLEGIVLSRRAHYDWRAYGVSLFDFVGRIAVTLFVPLSIASPLIAWVEKHRLTTLAVDSIGNTLLLFTRWSSSTTGCAAPATACAGSGATTRCTTPPTS